MSNETDGAFLEPMTAGPRELLATALRDLDAARAELDGWRKWYEIRCYEEERDARKRLEKVQREVAAIEAGSPIRPAADRSRLPLDGGRPPG